MTSPEPYKPKNKIRIVTAASLFDGHDAAINLMRRILQSSGCEVIHLGHNRSVSEIVECAIQEDVQAVAVTSYQGGHLEYFKYMHDLLKEKGAGHIKIFGGGGGVILPKEIEELHNYGIAGIYSPDDGRSMGLQGMINDMLGKCDFPTVTHLNGDVDKVTKKDPLIIAKTITYCENFSEQSREFINQLKNSNTHKTIPVIGLTGTGGSGKSSITDEIVRRLQNDFPTLSVAILSIDPTKKKTGGALLGDRIRMNSIYNEKVYMRSLATRHSSKSVSLYLEDAIKICKTAGFGIILVETSGIGQSDSEIVNHVDLSVYVMTSEYGAGTQLEKIDMLDYADMVVINKSDKKGSQDALRDVRKQYRRNHKLFDAKEEDLPVYATVASKFNDTGVNEFYVSLLKKILSKTSVTFSGSKNINEISVSALSSVKNQSAEIIIPPSRVRYLAEIAENSDRYKKFVNEQSEIARKLYQISGTLSILKEESEKGGKGESETIREEIKFLLKLKNGLEEKLDPECKKVLEDWEKNKNLYLKDKFQYKVRNQIIEQDLYYESLSHTRVPKISIPKFHDWGDILKWNLEENFPGKFPFTSGTFPLKRQSEDPTRMFAGEGGPERTNKRFHYVSKGQPYRRLSTAFDSVTLYGENPDYRPDIYGKIGNSGVSVATLDDAKKLYSGFNLCDPSTSVSMTINGPAPMLLGFFMNTAIDQQCEIYIHENNLIEQTYKKLLEIYKSNRDKIPFYSIEEVELEQVSVDQDDLELLEDIELRELQEAYGAEYTGQVKEFHQQFFSAKDDYAFLIKYQSAVAGFYVVKEMTKTRVLRSEIYILKKFRKKDIAGRAFPLICRFFYKKGVFEILNTCNSTHKGSIKFLEKNNFKLLEKFKLEKVEMLKFSAMTFENLNYLPEGNNGLGLMLLGVTGDQVLPENVYEEIKKKTLATVRGTVQADILKEDQAQNTCIFSTEFALKMMGDIQENFTRNKVRNFYSVSISGYHIAEAGANPISQLAFTLANGFTYVEIYLARGLKIDDFAQNLSFFFSNGIDPEYAVIGRVARRIWAKAIKYIYKGNERSQQLKYHIQTSGRSLHAQEIDFNDIRTTLQALYAIYDNCNSLHTNAHDEAITTPTETSVRRAMAIQHIINKELGLAKNENSLQGSFIIEELTDLVEEAVLNEFRNISERGGVLGAMETMYQRSKIQEESLYYETLKHNGEYPIVGVNTFLNSEGSPTIIPSEVIRSTTAEKEFAITTLNVFQERNKNVYEKSMTALKETAVTGKNLFDTLLEVCKVCSLGQISKSLYEVGGQYRRSM